MFDAFISHAHEEKNAADRLVEHLTSVGLTVWIDYKNVRGGEHLVSALQNGLLSCKNLVVLWSRNAAASDWVDEEWTAVVLLNKQKGADLERGIIPCRLDETQLPPFLLKYVDCSFRGLWDDGVGCVVAALRGPVRPTPDPEKWQPSDFVKRILRDQSKVLAILFEGKPEQARKLQAQHEPLVNEAVREYPEDNYILILAGYDKKNAYVIRYYDELQNGQRPPDLLLDEATAFFFKALSIEPFNPSALNGLGNVFSLRGDLEAAEFYIRKGIARAAQEGIPYEAAAHDLKMIQRIKGSL